VTTELISRPDDIAKRVEVVWATPDGEGPWPLLVLVHGHQEQVRSGAAAFVQAGTFDPLRQLGYVVAGVSQPR
jgi:dienelactone hydrolase